MGASAVGYAIAAAVFLAFSSALQHQAAVGEQGYRSGIHLLWRLTRNRRWMAGLAVAAVGALLHAAALRVGALAVVQPVLVLSLALALPVRALLERARPSAAQVVAAVALAAGVTVFVASAQPQAGHSAPSAGGAAVVITAALALAGGCWVAAARARSGRVAGFTLGLAAGTLYGVVGGVLKATVHAALGDPLTTLIGWPLWTLAGLGVWALVMHQRAYTHAPLRVSLPVLSVANPLAGMAFGVLVFGETSASGPMALVGEAVGLAVIVVSVMMLARLPAGASQPGAGAPDGGRVVRAGGPGQIPDAPGGQAPAELHGMVNRLR